MQHLSDVFAISKASVSKVFATWICFLAVTYKTCFIAKSSMGLLHIAS